MQRGRRTVAAQHRRGGKRVMPRSVKTGERRKKQEDLPLSPKERRRMAQILICGGIFVMLVALKLLLPGTVAVLREKAAGVLERNMDVQAVFSAVGRAVSGDGKGTEVYQAVFGVERAEEPDPIAVQVGEPHMALELLHTYHTVPEAEEPLVLYSGENLPEGVSMQQAILGFDYSTPVAGTLTSPFGYREHPIEGEDTFHYGVDLAAATGTEILCFADGVVGAVGESSSYGNYCTVNHSGGYTTLYAHCDRILARSGAEVKRGEAIAKVGSTGMATGSHLHFELLCEDVYLNPIYYITCAGTV